MSMILPILGVIILIAIPVYLIYDAFNSGKDLL